MIIAKNKVGQTTQGKDRGGGGFTDNRSSVLEHLHLPLSLHASHRGFSVLFISFIASAMRQQ